MRLAILEDNLPLLENLKIMLAGENGLTIAGAFSAAGDALGKMKDIDPDMFLVDLGLPDMPGVEFIRQAKTRMPAIDIMVYTVYDDWGSVFSALKAGATGYILKGTSSKELIAAITSMREGGAPMSPKIARMVINEFQDERGEQQPALSNREREILDSMNHGLTYRQIAAELIISPHTVRTHIKNIYEKLHVKNKWEALEKVKKQNSL